MSKPAAVILSDVHYNLTNLELSDDAMREALAYAFKNQLPLIVAGDLHDTKAMMRSEVVSRMIEIFERRKTDIYILAGNHDRENEKSPAHALEFLRPYATIIDKPTRLPIGGPSNPWYAIPYHSENEELDLNFPKGSVLIMHQGVTDGDRGDYVHDKSAIDAKLLKDFTCISGHYHRKHTVGTLTYCGSPFTMTFGEANDGPKGFLVVNEDGTYKQVVLKMRKHRIIEHTIESLAEQKPYTDFTPQDLTWLKVKGSRSELVKLNKKEIGERLFGHCNFKFDKLPLDSVQSKKVDSNLTEAEILDQLISRLPESEPKKKELKKLWREVVNGV